MLRRFTTDKIKYMKYVTIIALFAIATLLLEVAISNNLLGMIGFALAVFSMIGFLFIKCTYKVVNEKWYLWYLRQFFILFVVTTSSIAFAYHYILWSNPWLKIAGKGIDYFIN